MTGPLAQQIAQVRRFVEGFIPGMRIGDMEPCPTGSQALAALSAIEQWATDVALRVQDLERKAEAYDAARATVKREGLSRAEYVLRAQQAESRLCDLTTAADAYVNWRPDAPISSEEARNKLRAALPASGARNPRNRVAREKEEE